MKKLFVVFAVSSTLLAGCLGGARDEKQDFIDATVEATCLVFQSENIFDPALEAEAKAIYEDYGFDAENDEAMTALTTKYENDEDVQAAITAALEECAGDYMSAFGDMGLGDMTEEGATTEGEEVPSETVTE